MSGKYRKPPRILQNLLKFISKPEERFSVIGDFEEIYNDIAEEDELYTYKSKKARELMQLQADAFFKHQKNAL